MRKNSALLLICFMLVPSSYGLALADGAEKHGKSKQADARMKKLHDMMPMFSAATAKLGAALEKGDAAAVETESNRILAALPVLKKSRPHKNVKQRAKFVALAKQQEEAVTSVLDLAKSGDFAAAKEAFRKVEQTCAECHAKFRD